MRPDEIITMTEKMEKNIVKSKKNDTSTKYQTLALLHSIRKEVSYRVPMLPIIISEDGHIFDCPRCEIQFESESVADDFIFCPECGQRFRYGKKEEDNE